jgi:hypothetical protein
MSSQMGPIRKKFAGSGGRVGEYHGETGGNLPPAVYFAHLLFAFKVLK